MPKMRYQTKERLGSTWLGACQDRVSGILLFGCFIIFWRWGRDSNSRSAFTDSGFQDRCTKPLCDPTEQPLRGAALSSRVNLGGDVAIPLREGSPRDCPELFLRLKQSLAMGYGFILPFFLFQRKSHDFSWDFLHMSLFPFGNNPPSRKATADE